MSTKRHLLLAGSATAAIVQLAVPAAFAQDASQEATRTLEAVTVLGERFGEDYGRATFVLGADDVERLALGSDVTLSLARVPGIQVSTGDARGGSFSFEIYLRGLTDEQIGFSVDGVPTGDSRFNGGQPPQRFLESSNVGRIIVSQSAGDIGAPSRFALGGFIDFQTADPKDTFGVDLEAGYGSFDFKRGYGRVDFGEVLPGTTAYASYSSQSNNIWAGEDARSSERDHFEFKAVGDYDFARLTFRVSHNDQSDNDFNIISLAEFKADPDNDRATDAISGVPSIDLNYGGALGGNREDTLAYLKAEFDLTDQLSLTATPYFHKLNGESFRYQDRQRDLDGADPRAVTGYNANGGAIRPRLITTRNSNVVGGPADMRITPRDRERIGITSEARYEDFLGNQDLRFGLWYETNESDERRNFFPIADSTRSVDVAGQPLQYVEYERFAELTTTMLYAQDSVSLMEDRLKLDFGVTWMDIAYKARSPLEYRAVIDQSQDSGLNPKLGLTYDLADSLQVFGGYARNFSGIPEDTFLGSTAIIDIDELEPITSDNIDAGLRYIAGETAFSAQAYWVDQKNAVGVVPRDPTDPRNLDDILRGNVATKAQNVGGLETKGIELTGFHDFGPVDLYAAWSLQEARHKETSDAVEVSNLARLGVIAGKQVRDIPNQSFFFQGGWEPADSLRFETSVKYVGERVGGHIVAPDTCRPAACAGAPALFPLGVEKIDGYTLVGLSAAWSPEEIFGTKGLRIQLNADNLFDEDYIASVTGATATLVEFGAFGGAGRTLDRYFIGAPRTVTLSIKAEF